MATGGKFAVSVTPHGHEAAIEALQQMGGKTHLAIQRTQLELQTFIYDILVAQFQKAYQDNADGFPPAYFIHLLSKLSQIPIRTKQTAYTFTTEFNFGDLGTKEELTQGYHYGASLANGGQVSLPYHGAALKNDVQQRYQFWLALRYHITFNGRIIGEDLWSETIAARLAVWSSLDAAPQWLLLEYGQTEYAPIIQPSPIVETTRAAIKGAGEAMLVDQLFQINADLVRQFNPGYHPFGGNTGGLGKINKGLAFYLEGAKEPDLIHKQAKLATVYANYINQMKGAKTPGGVASIVKELSGLSGVEYSVLLETLRRGKGI